MGDHERISVYCRAYNAAIESGETHAGACRKALDAVAAHDRKQKEARHVAG